ncbi:MAG: hypothetical protein K2L17_08740, partial [Muribaculaceae bacterium]|nr:hypothetical protein [Muribaculaceae bacterium]
MLMGLAVIVLTAWAGRAERIKIKDKIYKIRFFSIFFVVIFFDGVTSRIADASLAFSPMAADFRGFMLSVRERSERISARFASE